MKKIKPDLKFKINIDQDIANAQDRFWRKGEFGSWFFPKNFQYILSKNFSYKEGDKIIAEEAKYFYQKNKVEIAKGVIEVKKQWQKVENDFYEIVDKVFQGYSWPKGKYVGCASIYNMYPRYIRRKTFFFPYSGKRINTAMVIGHEMLHFIFFDFIERKYKVRENTEFAGKNSKYVWRVSESFNNVIENWEPYKKIFKIKDESKPYPGCEKIFRAMKKQWVKKQDIETMLDYWFLKKVK
jgi:hypothetical protein